MIFERSVQKKAFWRLALKNLETYIRTILAVMFFCSLWVLSGCFGDKAVDSEAAPHLVVTGDSDDESELGDNGSQLSPPKGAGGLGGTGCDIRPNPADCCKNSSEDCVFCRLQAQQALEQWQVECLPAFEELKNCGPGVKISTCCGDDSLECQDCRMKALKAMISWRQKCSVPEGLDCSQPEPVDDCCKGGETLCGLCRERVTKLKLDRQRRCGRQSI